MGNRARRTVAIAAGAADSAAAASAAADAAAAMRRRPPADVRVLVVGATGYIGKFVVKELVQRGYQVVAFARERSGIGGKASADDTRKVRLQLLSSGCLMGCTAHYGPAFAYALGIVCSGLHHHEQLLFILLVATGDDELICLV